MAMMLEPGLPCGLGEATPFTAFLLTLSMTLAIGWLIAHNADGAGLSSVVVAHVRLSSSHFQSALAAGGSDRISRDLDDL